MAGHIPVWVASFLVSLIFLAALGLSINKMWFGVLIDARGKMSLSRLQLSLWTILIVSTLFSVSIAHETMNIIVPAEIWALMGISLGSAASAVIVKGVKSVQEPSENFKDKYACTSRLGLLHTNTDSEQAKFTDMFKGDEISDFQYIDISKVQMFFFTLAAWIGYLSAIYSHKFEPNSVDEIAFPALSTGIVTLIGISHTGYIAIKASDRTSKN